MAIPDYQTFMLPLLRWATDGNEYRLRDAYAALADEFNLSEEERAELLPSGRQSIVNNRIGWAKTYLVKAGLLQKTRRGFFKITGRGKDVLNSSPEAINVAFLNQFSEFVTFHSKNSTEEEGRSTIDSTNVENTSNASVSIATPEETLEVAYQTLHNSLADELLQTVKDGSPTFFENLVVDLLVKMGYGGSHKEAGAVGRTGDGGIDGIIKEDKLGLDAIYIQAKRWDDTTVGRPEIQKFAGALQGQRARKGIFITTSGFSANAHEYVKNIDSKIILIDGQRLASLMIDHDVGVSTMASYNVKKIDTDYFEEE